MFLEVQILLECGRSQLGADRHLCLCLSFLWGVVVDFGLSLLLFLCTPLLEVPSVWVSMCCADIKLLCQVREPNYTQKCYSIVYPQHVYGTPSERHTHAACMLTLQKLYGSQRSIIKAGITISRIYNNYIICIQSCYFTYTVQNLIVCLYIPEV